jgi:hypothetical protein
VPDHAAFAQLDAYPDRPSSSARHQVNGGDRVARTHTMITQSDGGEAPETRKLRDCLSRQPQPVTTEPKVIRWQADPERRAACGPSTGSGAAVLLRGTAGQSQEATKSPRNSNRTVRQPGSRVRAPGFSGVCCHIRPTRRSPLLRRGLERYKARQPFAPQAQGGRREASFRERVIRYEQEIIFQTAGGCSPVRRGYSRSAARRRFTASRSNGSGCCSSSLS